MLARSPRRTAFTLVELLVVIVILGILIALLVPVIAGAVRTANNAAVTSEITTMANSLAAFKEKYGDYPPSRVILNENGFFPTSSTLPMNSSSITWYANGSFVNLQPDIVETVNGLPTASGTDLTYGQLNQRSLRFLRKFFPRADLRSTGSPFGSSFNTGAGTFYDFNGNGVGDANPILLQGHECLVFFLGGIPNHAGTTLGMSGFANNPVFPFQNEASSTNRTKPFFEFVSDRLIDDDGDGIPGYVDGLAQANEARYYVYFSAYNNNGYDPNDVNFFGEVDYDAGGAPLERAFRVNFGAGSWYSGVTNVVWSPSPNPYTSSLPIPDYGLPSAGSQPAVYQRPTSFQIISAGGDRNYGFGGSYNKNSNASRLELEQPPTGSAFSGNPLYSPTSGGVRGRERDNLTNFATGTLE